MNIKTKESWEANGIVESIPDFVEGKLTANFTEGQVEQVRDEVSKLRSAFGRLLDWLASERNLSAQDLTLIARGYMDKTATFTDDNV